MEQDPPCPRDLRIRLLQMQYLAQTETSEAAQALLRLVEIVERRNSGQAQVVAKMLAAIALDGPPLEPWELRRLDQAISDDVLACLAGLRWGRSDPHTWLPDGRERIHRALALWGLVAPG